MNLEDRKTNSLLLPVTLSVGALLLLLAAMPTPETSAISLVLGLFYVFFIAFLQPTFIFKYLYFIVPIVLNVAGVATCEFTNTYLTELRCTTYFSGSLPLIVLARWTMIVVLLFVDTKMDNQNNEAVIKDEQELSHSRLSIINFITIVVAIIGAIMLLEASRQAPAFLSGIDRFSWINAHQSVLPGFLTSIYSLLLIFPALSIMYGKKFRGFIAVGFYLLYSLWTGAKYGPYLLLLCIFIWVYYEKIRNWNIVVIRRRLAVAVLGVLLLIFIAAFLQITYISTTRSLDEYLFQRLAQQGQLWWKTYDAVIGNLHPEAFLNEINLWGTEGPANNGLRANTGIYLIMYLCAPSGVVDSMITRGVNMTEAGYASAFYYFGPVGTVIFSLIIAVSLGIVLNWMLRAISQVNIIDSLILCRTIILLASLVAALRWDVFEPISLICYVYLIIASLIRKPHKQQLRKQQLHQQQFHQQKINRQQKLTAIAARNNAQRIDIVE